MSNAVPPFIVAIPARYGSTRLPAKPLREIDGVPMVVRVAQRALAGWCQPGGGGGGRPAHRRCAGRAGRSGNLHDPQRPCLGQRPSGRMRAALRLGRRQHRGEPAGRRTVRAGGRHSRGGAGAGRRRCTDGDPGHADHRCRGAVRSERGEAGARRRRACAVFQPGAAAVGARCVCHRSACVAVGLAVPAAYRHLRLPGRFSAAATADCRARRWSRPNRWSSCACWNTATRSRCG